jgi:hypothetical protein
MGLDTKGIIYTFKIKYPEGSMKRFLLLLFALVFAVTANAQVGGSYTYAFLNQTNSAKVAALGGKSVALPDDDLNLPFHNPSLLDSGMHNHIVLNYVGYFAGINYGYASYARNVSQKINVAAGIHYIDYGTFPYADETGMRTGENFSASEYAVNLIGSYRLDSSLTLGVNIKPVYTSFESYYSAGLVADLGMTYHNPAALFTAAFVLRNIGTQLTRYYEGSQREPLPFEIQAGVSQKLEHAPFRFSLLLQHLQKWDLTYESNLEDDSFADPYDNAGTRTRLGEFSDKLLRHAILGAEFMPGKNFYVSLGYNYQRRQELKLSPRIGMVGFSWGFGLKVSKFNFSYAKANYHLAGASNHFSLGVNLSDFYRAH